MKHIIILTAAILLLGGSCTCRKAATHVVEQRQDSTRIEYRERTIYVPDTVFVEIPKQTAERTTSDSVSHLENDYASSDASVNSDGTLIHTLRSKSQTKPVPINRPVEYRDSIVYKDRIINKTNTVTKCVGRKRSWWDQTQIYGFWVAIIIVAIAYRKKLFKVVVRLFLKK